MSPNLSNATPSTLGLVDPFSRTIDYLRVSVTDRCNFRCVYCMPEEGVPATPKAEHLTTAEFARLIRVAASLGMRKVRLTGGEPLLRKDLPELVAEIASIPGIEDLSCTTNGFLLAEMASDLARAGLGRVNVSLDTLRPERFTAIARRGELAKVLEGIKAAQEAGLSPLKINCVAMRGFNDDEAAEFARWTLSEEVHVRFIELMPMRWNLDEGPSSFESFGVHQGQGLLQLRNSSGGMLSDVEMRRRFVPAQELRSSIEKEFGPLEEAEVQTNGPARTYRIPGAKGTVGFISQITFDFCSRCNRLRLTHDGFLRPCLMSDGELDLRTALRSGANDAEIADLFRHTVAHKPERHYLAEGQRVTGRGMSQIGG
jgi:cyclic pyranopterin phosphate synthase